MTYNYTVNVSDGYPIENDIPIPPRNRSGGTACKYPWDLLEVGQSFLVHHRSKYPGSIAASGNERATRKKSGKYYIGRRAEDGGYRIWRTK